jgi:excisionase family DNA binding protein
MAHLSTADTAQRLGITRQHVVVLIDRGELKAQRVGRSYIIDVRSIEAFERRDRPGPGRPAKGRA